MLSPVRRDRKAYAAASRRGSASRLYLACASAFIAHFDVAAVWARPHAQPAPLAVPQPSSESRGDTATMRVTATIVRPLMVRQDRGTAELPAGSIRYQVRKRDGVIWIELE